jgi:hypothetical protein
MPIGLTVGLLACFVCVFPVSVPTLSKSAKLKLVSSGGEARSLGKAGPTPGVFGALGDPAALEISSGGASPSPEARMVREGDHAACSRLYEDYPCPRMAMGTEPQRRPCRCMPSPPQYLSSKRAAVI